MAEKEDVLETETVEEPETVETEVIEPEVVEESETESTEEPDEVTKLQQEIEVLTRQLADQKNDLLRAYADTENTRRRLQREADLVKQYRFQSAAQALLPVIDNMESALAHIPENNPEAENFAKGFTMIQSQLNKVLADEGVVEIEALDQPFDANFMQALMTGTKEGVEPGVVIEVLQKGYKIKDRLLRPALVKVSE